MLTPTPEQDQAMGLFMTGDHLVIEAFAGTGKTSTLELVARSTQRNGTYTAFNRAAVTDAAARMPMSVASRTAHSLAFRAVGSRYVDRLNAPRVHSAQIGKLLGMDPVVVRVDGRDRRLAAGFLAGLVMRTITAWCHSDDPTPTGRWMPKVHGIDEPGSNRHNNELRTYLQPWIERAWQDLQDPAGRLPYRHDHYLTQWALGSPDVPGDFLLVDEAQDLNPRLLQVIAHNADRGSQIVLVGDSNQAIYGWRNATDALQRVPWQRTRLTKSWRFGPAVADVANMILSALGPDLVLTGNPAIDSKVEACSSPDAVLTRSNAGALDVVLASIRSGGSPHLVGGGEELVRFAKAVAQLQETGRSTHPDLACFESWGEVVAYVEDDPAGSELALMVKLVTDYGLQIVIDALDGMVAETHADLIVSTAHRGKGREWDRVQLGADFPEPEHRPATTDEELRLLYVAATRARRVLDVRMCEPLVDRLAVRAPL